LNYTNNVNETKLTKFEDLTFWRKGLPVELVNCCLPDRCIFFLDEEIGGMIYEKLARRVGEKKQYRCKLIVAKKNGMKRASCLPEIL
jgi:hypothetical protein